VPNTIVLARDDYQQYADRHRAMIAYLQSLLATRPFLFVGFSLIDPNFRVIHHAIREALGAYRRTAYALDRGPWRYHHTYWREKGVTPVLVGEFADMPPFIDRILSTGGPHSGIAALAVLQGQQPPPIAVGPLLAHLDSLTMALQATFADLRAQGFLPDADASPAEVTPDEVVDRGAGGSGCGRRRGRCWTWRWRSTNWRPCQMPDSGSA
jgi:hypothetical protein